MPISPSLGLVTSYDFEARSMTPRRLEIIKVEFSDAHYCRDIRGVLIGLLHYGLIPPLEPFPWLIPLAWFGLLLFGFLWLIQLVIAL